ncbi:MAG: aspartate kinase [Planctomycetota bacterium]
MQVFKFGGSCLTGPTSLNRVHEIVAEHGTPVVCVFSALKGVTDRLIRLSDGALAGEADPEPLIEEHRHYLEGVTGEARAAADRKLDALADELRRTLKGIEYLGEVSPRVLDRIMSLGERGACVLAEALLTERGLPIHAVPDGDPGLVSDGVFGDARVLKSSRDQVRALYSDPDSVYVVPGFVARSAEGAITTLGRGGSDYSATYLGASLGATTTLWKDTAGLLTASPKIVESPRLIKSLPYLDALELAHYGTEAIAEKAILPAMEAGTVLEIRSFADPGVVTRVDAASADALAITCVSRAVMIDFLGLEGGMLETLANLFGALNAMQTYPLLVTEASPRGETSMVLKEKDLPRLQRYLAKHRIDESPQIREDLGVVSLIGSHMRGRVGMAAAIFECLARSEINVIAIAQTASERNVSVTVLRDDVEKAVRELHERFLGSGAAAA